MIPLVSVMIPCCNAIRTLPLALASLFAQTYTNWECIIVDDGSTDQPIEVVEVINDHRIQFHRFADNRGRAAARQQALDMAQGKYLCMIDADDWIYPEKIKHQVEVMEANPDLAVLSTDMAVVDAGNRVSGIRTNSAVNSGLSIFPRLSRPNIPPVFHGPSIIKMELAKNVGYDLNFHLAEDIDFLLRIITQHNFGHLSKVTYVYSELESITINKILQSLRLAHRIFSKYQDQYPVTSYSNHAILIVKELIYRAGFATGFGQRLIERRSQRPTEKLVDEFYRARKTVYTIGNVLFSGSSFIDTFRGIDL